MKKISVIPTIALIKKLMTADTNFFSIRHASLLLLYSILFFRKDDYSLFSCQLTAASSALLPEKFQLLTLIFLYSSLIS